MIEIREETMRDVEEREALLDICFGAERFLKTCERLREGRVPAQGLSLVIERDGTILGTVRMWHVSAGADLPALMLGPIAIDPSCQGLGLGAKLMREALARAKAQGHKAVVLVGDASYYERFGFSADCTRDLRMPGPFERERLLGLALEAGALDGSRGLIFATGDVEAKPDLSILVTAASRGMSGVLNRAA